MRACYTVPGLFGADHHNAYMQIIPIDENTSQLIWVTDVLPDSFAEEFRSFCDGNFADIVKAVEQA
ncbi:hypothetical protein [Saccharomonospora viridis]|jgi:hypothetical protein|uniref:hypothetical protein n=1 Tax=Saccharomonospora viridis TaxID=1852 RepID=UPI0001A38580|nr:hypothetical protein [Saccharomonospora viridis]